MKERKIYNVAISCVGSGIGQSVINAIRLSKLPIKTFGLDVNPMAFGIYDCDEFIAIPPVSQKDYVSTLIAKCLKYKIDLLIPGIDNEVLLFAQHLLAFSEAGIKVIVSDHRFLALCRDKAKMSAYLGGIVPVFVKSYDKQTFVTALEQEEVCFPVIAKPRDGSGSHGIHIVNSMHDFDTLAGDFILQELAIPHKKDPDRIHYEAQLKRNRNLQVAELSIQIVADQQGDVKGQMMSYNKLKNGVPVEIFPYENESIVLAISKLYPVLKELGMRGPVNIQGRLTDKGLQIFEINARFTGITGLRACMGFNEVEACIKEWLNIGGIQDSLKVNTNRFGMRQVADKAIHLGKNLEVQQRSALINGKTLTVKTTLLLTGATGYLGRNLIDSLLEDKAPFVIFALVRDKKKAVALLPEAVTCFDWEDLENGVLSLGSVDVLLHAGFARPHRSQEELADSLAFTSELFRRATSHQVAHIVNISSQSVYGQADLPPWSETATIAPNTPYGMAKYASELLLESNVGRHQHIQYTSIRLGGLVGGAKGLVEVDVVARLVSKALRSEGIEVKGGMQIVERLDIRDAVTAISALLNKQNVRWEPVYNLGSSAPIRLLDLVEQIVDTVSHEAKVPRSIIAVKDEAVSMFYGMDCASFYRDFEWRPKYSMVDCIKSMIAFKRESDILMAQK